MNKSRSGALSGAKRVVFWAWTALFVFLASATLLPAQQIGTDELSALAALDGEAYASARDLLIARMSMPLGSSLVSRLDWESGIAAIVIGGRVADAERVAEWDAFVPWRSRAGEFVPVPPHGERDPVARAYMLERLWKTSPNEPARKRALESLFSTGVPGSVVMWGQLVRDAPTPELQAAALFAVLSVSPERMSEAAIREILGDSEQPAVVRRAIIVGLRNSRPSFAADLLLQAMPSLRSDRVLYRETLHALAAQAGDAARQSLYVIAADQTAEPEERVNAIGFLSAFSQAEDLPKLAELARDQDYEVSRTAIVVLRGYPMQSARPFLHELVREPPSQNILFRAIEGLARHGDAADLAALRDISKSTENIELNVDKARQAIAQIERRVASGR